MRNRQRLIHRLLLFVCPSAGTRLDTDIFSHLKSFLERDRNERRICQFARPASPSFVFKYTKGAATRFYLLQLRPARVYTYSDGRSQGANSCSFKQCGSINSMQIPGPNRFSRSGFFPGYAGSFWLDAGKRFRDRRLIFRRSIIPRHRSRPQNPAKSCAREQRYGFRHRR
jgi:hypothetical protein